MSSNAAGTIYEHNVVYRSPLTGQFYFAPKVRVLANGIRQVIGRKYDITKQIAPYLLTRYRPKWRLR